MYKMTVSTSLRSQLHVLVIRTNWTGSASLLDGCFLLGLKFAHST